MYKNVFILVIGVILIMNSNQVGPQTEVLTIEGTSSFRLNIPADKLIVGCSAYDYRLAKAQNQVIKCVACGQNFALISIISSGTQICQSIPQSVTGCTVYDNTNLDNCLKCRSDLNALPVDSGAGYICSLLAPLNGDGGIQFTSCKYYDSADRSGVTVICLQCNAPLTGTAPVSNDCSIKCTTAGQSIRFYLDSTGMINYSCTFGRKSTCSLYTREELNDCLSCYSPYVLITMGTLGSTFCYQQQYRVCVHPMQATSQCDYYQFDRNRRITCAQCAQTGTQIKKYQRQTDFASICTIGDKPTEPQPDGYFYVTVPVYAPFFENNLRGKCGGGGQQYESNCLKLSSTGLQCDECFTGYTLIKQYSKSNTLTRCVKRIYFCKIYDRSICIQCLDRYYLSKVKGQQFCNPVSNDCLQFQPFGGRCFKCASPLLPSTAPGQCEFNTTCPDGQYFDQSAKTCKKGTIENCKQYAINRPDFCLKCLEGYKFNSSGGCEKIKADCKNTTDMNFVDDRGTCKRIDPLCIDWIPDPNTQLSVLCTNCGNHYLNQGMCLKVGTRRM